MRANTLLAFSDSLPGADVGWEPIAGIHPSLGKGAHHLCLALGANSLHIGLGFLASFSCCFCLVLQTSGLRKYLDHPLQVISS